MVMGGDISPAVAISEVADASGEHGVNTNSPVEYLLIFYQTKHLHLGDDPVEFLYIRNIHSENSPRLF